MKKSEISFTHQKERKQWLRLKENRMRVRKRESKTNVYCRKRGAERGRKKGG